MSVKAIILCEDRQMACFIRRFLKRQRYDKHEIRMVSAPPGVGSGEQWVRNQYPKELKALRQRTDSILIVATDADTMSVADRVKTLDDECRLQGVDVRAAAEQVVMVIPARSIETWFAYLRGETFDEHKQYPRYRFESECENDVARLDDMCRQRLLKKPAPASLNAACKEFARLR